MSPSTSARPTDPAAAGITAVSSASISSRTSRRRFLQVSAAALGNAVIPASVFGYGAQAPPRISTTDLGGAMLFQGAGCNVIAMSGPEERRQGVPSENVALMIDGGLAANADALLAAVTSAMGTSRIHTLINTHWHPEQTGANEAVGRSGGVIFAHEKTKTYLSNAVYSVTFKGRRPALPQAARPTRTTRGDGSMEFAGQPIEYGYMPAAHTDSDLFIHIPRMNLLVTGGVVSAEEWPLLDYRNGAWLGGRVRALERLADLVKPDTRVVPANGRLMTGSEIVRHRDMYQKLFTTMIGYLNMGLGPEDAVQRNPLKEHQAEFGDPSAFTYGALKSMMIAYVPD
jgi:glyoxylase-like metal-dependent hydrolase (beta-lactamase superfamily II)